MGLGEAITKTDPTSSRKERYAELMDRIKANETIDIIDLLEECNEPIVFMTGKAGSGKSLSLRRFVASTKKKVVVCAPTGVAALNCKGSTIHRLFGLPIGYLSDKEIAEVALRQTKVVKSADVLIVDECSMVDAPMLDTLDAILRAARRNRHEPFGGMQIVLCGDQYQLSPVTKQGDWDNAKMGLKYETPLFFSSKVIRDNPPVVFEMDKIFRQDPKEQEFITILNAVRDGEIDDALLARLNSRVRPDFKEVAGYVSIVATNAQVDSINRKHLEQLPGPEKIYGSVIEGDFNPRSAPCDDPLSLRVGAQIMFIANDPTAKGSAARYVNGTVGQVEAMGDDDISIQMANGSTISAAKFTWENIKYGVGPDGQLSKEVIGTYTQFPIRVAAAMTIHKTQSVSLDRAIIDASRVFEAGQLYVALSRCRSLAGIVLRSPITRSVVRTNKAVIEWSRVAKESGRSFSIQQKFLGSEQLVVKESKSETQAASEADKIVARLGRGEFLSNDEFEAVRDMGSEQQQVVANAGLELFIDEILRLRLENRDLASKIKTAGRKLEKANQSDGTQGHTKATTATKADWQDR